MDQAQELRRKAAHCIRLANGIVNPVDFARFEALAAAFVRAAEVLEEAKKAMRDIPTK